MLFGEETTLPYRARLRRSGMISLLRRGARRAGWSKMSVY